LRRSLGADIEIEIVACPDLWPTNAQLENSIINLAVNAREGMPEGGKLTIETANIYLDSDYARRNPGVTPGQYVLLEVSDTGTGMEAEVADRAFEPFFTTKEVDEGSGLGLSMIYGFARPSGGLVKIFSAENHGTSVWLCLPKAEETTATPMATLSQLSRGHQTILVVEDNAAVLEVVVTQLESLGYVWSPPRMVRSPLACSPRPPTSTSYSPTWSCRTASAAASSPRRPCARTRRSAFSSHRGIRARPASWWRSSDRAGRCYRSPTRRGNWPKRCGKCWTPRLATCRLELRSRLAPNAAERRPRPAGPAVRRLQPPTSRADIGNHDSAVDAIVRIARIR